jgi:hypothetical protein
MKKIGVYKTPYPYLMFFFQFEYLITENVISLVSLLPKILHGKQNATFFSGQYSSQSNNLNH